MDFFMYISGWIVAIDEGRIITRGKPQDVRESTAVIEAYLS
jgi:ABC-type branched-subunit amino acid transport system ATPase component